MFNIGDEVKIVALQLTQTPESLRGIVVGGQFSIGTFPVQMVRIFATREKLLLRPNIEFVAA